MVWYNVTNVSEGCTASFFKAEEYLKDDGSIFLRNVHNDLPDTWCHMPEDNLQELRRITQGWPHAKFLTSDKSD
jgi:hypothetical protein